MWFVLLTLIAGGGPSVQVEMLSGQTHTGTLVQLTGEQVTVEAGQGQVTLQSELIRELAVSSEQSVAVDEPTVWVRMVDGSVLVAMDYTVDDGTATINTLWGTALEAAARDIASVRFQPQSEALASEWSRIVASKPDSDLLVTGKADVLDYHAGLVGDVTESTVQFRIEGELLPVKRGKVYGLVYYQSAGRDLPDAVCSLTQTDGSQWAVRSIQLDGDTLDWTSAAGVEVTAPLDRITRIDFSGGKIRYLSQLEPESLVWTPFFGMGDRLETAMALFGLRKDRSLGGGRFELDGRQYERGLALHSRTEVVYRLPAGFRRFRTTAGIDDRVRPHGNVALVIRGDDGVLFDEVLTGTDHPVAIDLDIAGVRRLAILVDFSDDMDVSDHLDLCEARLVK